MKILVFCPNWVGDAAMATPALRALRQLHPDAEITGIMRPLVAETLDGNPWLDDVLPYDPKARDRSLRSIAAVRQIRRRRFDLGILMTNSIRTAMLAWLGNVKRRVGYAREGRRLLLNDPLTIRRSAHRGYAPTPIIDYYLGLIYHLGAPKQDYRLELFTAAENDTAADELFRKWKIKPTDEVVVLNPGAAFGAAKRWPSQYFADLAHRLVERPNTRVIVLCGPSERGLARFISDASLRPRLVHHLAEEDISIGLSKSIVQRSRLMVSTDSGPRHFAAAFGVPVVSLFGPTHIEWTDTYFSGEIKLQKKLPCGPCQQRICPLGHLKCMTELTVDLVHENVLRLLETNPLRLAG